MTRIDLHAHVVPDAYRELLVTPDGGRPFVPPAPLEGLEANMTRYAIDYQKCMFCALCTAPCPTQCIHMGSLHDLSGYDRESMIVEFTKLAKQGLQTPVPIWMQKERLPAWAQAFKNEWIERGRPVREKMIQALEESQVAPKASTEAEKKTGDQEG